MILYHSSCFQRTGAVTVGTLIDGASGVIPLLTPAGPIPKEISCPPPPPLHADASSLSRPSRPSTDNGLLDAETKGPAHGQGWMHPAEGTLTFAESSSSNGKTRGRLTATVQITVGKDSHETADATSTPPLQTPTMLRSSSNWMRSFIQKDRGATRLRAPFLLCAAWVSLRAASEGCGGERAATGAWCCCGRLPRCRGKTKFGLKHALSSRAAPTSNTATEGSAANRTDRAAFRLRSVSPSLRLFRMQDDEEQ